MSNRNALYQEKFAKKQAEKGFKRRTIGLKQDKIDKINRLRKDKGISFDDALDELLS